MKATSSMTKKKGKGNLHGKMGEYTMDNGRMGSSTGEESSYLRMA